MVSKSRPSGQGRIAQNVKITAGQAESNASGDMSSATRHSAQEPTEAIPQKPAGRRRNPPSLGGGGCQGMVTIIQTIWGRGKMFFPPSNTFIIVLALFLCGVFLFPNGQETRVQRFGNMHLAALLCVGLYAMRFNGWVGTILVYSVLFMAVTVSEMSIITVMLIMGILFCLLAGARVNVNRIYDMICVIALLNVLWQILQYFKIYIINWPIEGFTAQNVGLMGNTNEVSALLALCLPCFFRRKWVFFIPFICLGLYLAGSRSGVVAAAAVSIIYAISKLERINGAVVIVAIIFCLLMVDSFVRPIFSMDRSFRERITANRTAIDVASYTLWTGWGIGQFKNVFPLVSAFPRLKTKDAEFLMNNVHDMNTMKSFILDKRAKDQDYFKSDKISCIFLELHNEYLEWFFNTGLIGLTLLMIGLGVLFYHGFATGSLAVYGFLASCLCSLWFFGWHIIPTAFITVVYAGIIENEWRQALCR